MFTTKHDACVAAYRTNKTDKCTTEIIAACVRENVEFGSEEYMSISRTCTLADCRAKYHWCPTCCIAPRCDCRMPHQSPITILEDESPSGIAETKWITSQKSVLVRMRKIPCDNRYWTFVLATKSLAVVPPEEPVKSKFCESCTTTIRSVREEILGVFGRTYLEQSHYIWSILKRTSRGMCGDCIMFINRLPCMYMGCDCPSDAIELITVRLEEYQSRKTRDAEDASNHTNISSIRSVLVDALHNHTKDRTDSLENNSSESKTTASHCPEGKVNGNVTFKFVTSKRATRKAPKVKSDLSTPVETAASTIRSEEWTYFWSDPNGPIKSLVDQKGDY